MPPLSSRQNHLHLDYRNGGRVKVARREAEAARRRHVGYLTKARELHFERNVRGLLRMAQSGVLDERATALPMLGMLGDPAALEALLRLLDDPAQQPLHGGAAKALIRYQDPQVVPAIQAAIRGIGLTRSALCYML